MAIPYHLNVGIVSRGQGQSVIAKAAYNSREKLREERTGEMKDYTYRKDRPLWSGIFVDKAAPAWAQDRQKLWNAADQHEKRKDSQIAYNVIAALPYQLTDQQRQNILKDFMREQFLRKGVAADVNMHAPDPKGDDRNHHVHILVSMREMTPEGFGPRRVFEWKDKEENLARWREKWAERCARELEKAGHKLEADRWREGHRTLEQQRRAALERGDAAYAETLKNREPTKHRGPKVDAMERKGIETERGNIHREILRDNEAAKNNATLKIELAKIQKEIAQHEREWADAVARAAIEKENIERRFVEPKPERTARQEKDQPEGTPRRAAQPEGTPEQFRGVDADIWEAHHRSDSARSLAAALEETGMALAVATKQDIALRPADSSITGKHRPIYREGEIVLVTDRAHVHRLDESNTGHSAADMQRYLRTLDTSKLQSIGDTKQLMHDRAAQYHAQAQLAAALNPVKRTPYERPLNVRSIAAGIAQGPLTVAKSASRLLAIVKAPLTGLGLVLNVLARFADSLFELGGRSGPPKTRAEIDKEIRDDRREAQEAAHDADAAHRQAVYFDQHQRIAAKHQDEAQRTQRERDEYRKRQQERGDRDR